MQFAQEVGGRLLRFLLGQVLADGVLLALFRRTCFADIVQLDDVPAELGADRGADLAGFEFVDGFFNGATIMPSANQPKSPPLPALLSCEYWRAKPPKSAPLRACE